MSCESHIDLCKRTALGYLPDDTANAWLTFCDQMKSRGSTKRHPALEFGSTLMLSGYLDCPEKMRGFLERCVL